LYLDCSFSMLNLSFVNPNSPSYFTLTAYILWIQQTRTTESEVLHMILPNWPLTLQQNPKTTQYRENRVSIWLVYHIRRFIFIHYQQLSLNSWNFKCCHSAWSQLYPPSKFCKILQHTNNSVPHHHRSDARTRGTMNYLERSHMQGRIMINRVLSIQHVRPWELGSDTTLSMSRDLQVCRDLQVHLV